MALEPTRIAVDFVRQTRNSSGSLVGSALKLIAAPTTGRLTKASEHGYFELPPSIEAVPDPVTGAGVLLLYATTEHDSPWGWKVKVDGDIEWRRVTIPTAPTPPRTLTVGGTSYPAAYLTSLAAFTG